MHETISNMEAAAAVVLYANPPRTAMQDITLPAVYAISAMPVEVDPRAGEQLAAILRPADSPVRPQVFVGPERTTGWWEELMCRFSMFAPLCGEQWLS